MKVLERKEEFIKNAKLVHGDLYDYSQVEYNRNNENVDIICKEHGVFKQQPNNHVYSGQGCPKCAGNYSYTTEEFIDKCREVHGDKYDYSKTVYTRGNDKIIIGCEYHGDFKQSAYLHSIGTGCEKCNLHNSGWTAERWYESGMNSKHFESFKIYVIRCWNEDEEFYKIGRTYYPLKTRFSSITKMPYEYEIVMSEESVDAHYIRDLERALILSLSKYEYIPENRFKGYRECVKVDYNTLTSTISETMQFLK